jgi:methyl-accepting chemotaxis protein
MTLRLKILLGFLILATMLFAAGLASIYELNQIGHSVKALLDDNYKSIDAAKNMIESLEREDSGVLLLMSGEWETGRATTKQADQDFKNAFNTARNNITIPGEETYINDIELNYSLYKNLWIHPIVGTKREGNLNWYFSKVHPAFLKCKSAVNRLMSLNDKTMYNTASALQNRAERAIMPGIVAIVAALIFTIIFNFFINLYVIKPIKKFSAGIKEYTKKGEMTGFRVESHDELSTLSEDIKELIAHIKKADELK